MTANSAPIRLRRYVIKLTLAFCIDFFSFCVSIGRMISHQATFCSDWRERGISQESEIVVLSRELVKGGLTYRSTCRNLRAWRPQSLAVCAKISAKPDIDDNWRE